jgi:hypothetical protein
MHRKIFKVKKQQRFVKPPSGDSLKETTRTLWHRQAKERLERNLESLSCYCRPGTEPEEDVARDGWADGLLRGISGSYKRGCWPSRELLREIENDVLVLALRTRKNPISPVWKAFEQVDKRMPKLRLKLRVENLIRRARDILSGESVLGKTLREAWAGNAQAQCSLRDMVLDTQKLAELLQADRQMVIQRCRAQPLVCWVIEIGHPMAKDLNNIVELFGTVEEMKAEQRREKARERVRRHRLGKKTSPKSVTPV